MLRHPINSTSTKAQFRYIFHSITRLLNHSIMVPQATLQDLLSGVSAHSRPPSPVDGYIGALPRVMSSTEFNERLNSSRTGDAGARERERSRSRALKYVTFGFDSDEEDISLAGPRVITSKKNSQSDFLIMEQEFHAVKAENCRLRKLLAKNENETEKQRRKLETFRKTTTCKECEELRWLRLGFSRALAASSTLDQIERMIQEARDLRKRAEDMLRKGEELKRAYLESKRSTD
jgi:hypothetical protein